MTLKGQGRQFLGFVLFTAGLLVMIVVPFLIFGSAFENFVENYFGQGRGQLARGAMVVFLLASDVLLPVPSSVVATLAGMQLGFFAASFANGLGLGLGAAIGLALGQRARAALPSLGQGLPKGFEAWIHRRGVVALLICRPIPVLAEASLILGGIAGLRFWPTIAWLLPAELGVGAVYAGAGALEYVSPVPGVALAIGIIGIPLTCALAASALSSQHASAIRMAR